MHPFIMDDRFEVARKGRGWFGTVLVVLENILVVESYLGVLYWFMVVLELYVMVVMVWSGCNRHGVSSIELSGPGAELVVL